MGLIMYHSHDALSKNFLGNIAVARDFLKAHLPEEIQMRCNFKTLRIETTSFVEPDLRQHFSDILYSVKIDGERGLIYTLIESQSTPLILMPLRFLRYVASALKKYAENHKGKKLPVIIPMLLYTGRQSPYPYSLDLFDCFNDPVLARKTLLHPRLVDLSVIPDQTLKTHGFAAFLELTQKHIKDRDILNLARDITDLLRTHPIPRELYQHMLQYLLSSGESLDYEAFFKVIIERTAAEYREDTMTIAEQLRREGYKKGIYVGIEQGIEQGMQKGEREKAMQIAYNMLINQFDHETIKKITGLSSSDLSGLPNNH